MRFYLGTHQPGWLDHVPDVRVPLFVSHNRMKARKYMPQARYPWAVDSGAFTELQKQGGWRISVKEFVHQVRRYGFECDRRPDFIAAMDWMCEDIVINGGVTPAGVRFVGTHLSVAEHQRRTVRNYVECHDLAPEINWVATVQGDTRDAYLRCGDMYEAAGVDLSKVDRVGLGSICRRQATDEIYGIIRDFSHLRLHGFGVKTKGLAKYGHLLTSADSLAWSYRGKRVLGCTPTHKNEANCLPFALSWRERALVNVPGEPGDSIRINDRKAA